LVARWTAAAWLAAGAASAQGQAPADVAALSLEDLLRTEVISSASKFPQEIREAPASVSIVTADDIRRYGYRTLADVLRGVRGLYTTYDRNYSYIGIRGVSVPGDYNTRVLLMVNGTRLNDGVYDMAPIGTDFPVDLSLVERVEVIRGPGSALYGTSAFFAVVNVVTRSGALRRGVQVETYGGSLATRGAELSFGRAFGDGELLIGVSAHRAHGAERLYFPEFDTGDPGAGVALDRDGDERAGGFVSWSVGRFSFTGAVAERTKQVPTASFGTIFGDRRAATVDRRQFASVTYDGTLAHGLQGTARVAYRGYHYEGRYPYGGDAPYLWEDGVDAQAVAAELTLRRRIARRHQVTGGVELRRHVRNRQWAGDESGVAFDIDDPGTVAAAYVQDEARLFRWLLVNAGVRLDRHPGFGNHLTPRAGVVILPRPQTSVKVLRGHAFRAPNAYERQYFDAMRAGLFTLRPEQFKGSEIVWEEYFSRSVRATVSLFEYDAYDLVEQRDANEESGDALYFVNGGHLDGRGAEAELDVRFRGVLARYSHTYARLRNRLTGGRPSNSPRHLGKASVQLPVTRQLAAAVEGQYVGRRLTLGGTPLPAYFVPSLTVSSPPDRRLAFSVGVYNLFDASLADPGAEEHVQQSIPQDGRTVLARVIVTF
jgi:iron complex outermembrane receptor protein